MCRRLFVLILCICGFLFAKETGYEAGKVTVKLKKSVSPSILQSYLPNLAILKIEPRFHAQKDEKGFLSNIYELSFDEKISPYAVSNALKQSAAVVYAEPIFWDEVFDVPNDTLYIQTLNLAYMQAESAWSLHKCEQNPILIAIVDTGVAYKHPDLAPNIWHNLAEDANQNGYTMYYDGSAWVLDAGDLNGIDDDNNGKIDDLIGWNFLLNSAGDENNDPNDPGSHGTKVAGLAGAVTNNSIGLASLSWNPVLMPISCARAGATSTIFRGYDAILYAAENGAKIINCSWGGTGYSAAAKDVIDYVTQLGTIVVAAAGNSNDSTPIYPAAYPGVLAVAALYNNGSKWSGSNYGAYVDFGVPNQNFYTTTPPLGYYTGTGATSYASPLGTALAALAVSHYPEVSATEIKHRIIATCDNIDAQNPNYIYKLGGGIANAFNALDETEPYQEPCLKLDLFSQGLPHDHNGDSSIDPNDLISLNFILRNYSMFSDNATLTISSSNPDIEIIQAQHNCTIPADEFINLQDAFSISISSNAASQYVNLQLEIDSSIPIHSASSFNIGFYINNGGILVWEPIAGGRDLSGTFIRNTLLAQNYEVVYGNVFPGSLQGYDAVFLSFGSVGTNNYRLNELFMYEAIRDYLLDGGKLYIEGADAIGFDLEYYLGYAEEGLGAHTVLWQLLGISNGSDGTTNAISLLQAQLPFSEIVFNSSNQVNVEYIDKFTPANPNGFVACTEDSYGTVAIASKGEHNQRSFVFSYAMAELVDSAHPNTAINFLSEVLNWFANSPTPQIQRNESGLRLTWELQPLVHTYKVLYASEPYGIYDVLAEDIEQNFYDIQSPYTKGFYRLQANP